MAPSAADSGAALLFVLEGLGECGRALLGIIDREHLLVRRGTSSPAPRPASPSSIGGPHVTLSLPFDLGLLPILK